jgi:uncharacterized protein (DUF1778 family)
MAEKRAAIYVRCTPEEAEKIRKAARTERRTISGYILNAALGRIEMRQRFLAELGERHSGEKKSAA